MFINIVSPGSRKWIIGGVMLGSSGNSSAAYGLTTPGGQEARAAARPWDFFISCRLFFPFSLISACIHPLLLCLFSFLLFPCASVRGKYSCMSSTFSIAIQMELASFALLGSTLFWLGSAIKLNTIIIINILICKSTHTLIIAAVSQHIHVQIFNTARKQ